MPQFWNALQGDYSVVGPRKYTNTEWDELVVPQARPDLVSDLTALLGEGLKFGLTGLDIVTARDYRGTNIVDQRLLLNVLYGENANFMADLRILGLTFGVLFQGK